MRLRRIVTALAALAMLVVSVPQAAAWEQTACRDSSGYILRGILWDVRSDSGGTYWVFAPYDNDRTAYYISFRHGDGRYSDGYVSSRHSYLKIYDNDRYSKWTCEGP